jgi:hypothetical protein
MGIDRAVFAGGETSCCRAIFRTARRCSATLTPGRLRGLWETINFLLLQQPRERAGREASPSAGVIPGSSPGTSQSAKTTESGGPRGYDAGKKVKGRKRHIVTDTAGASGGGAKRRHRDQQQVECRRVRRRRGTFPADNSRIRHADAATGWKVRPPVRFAFNPDQCSRHPAGCNVSRWRADPPGLRIWPRPP